MKPFFEIFEEIVKKVVDLKTNYGDEEAYGKALEYYMSNGDYWLSDSFEDWLKEFLAKEELEEYYLGNYKDEVESLGFFLEDLQDAIIGEIEERYNNYDYDDIEINGVLSFPKDFIPPKDDTDIYLTINEKDNPAKSRGKSYRFHYSSKYVTINGGKSTASFSFMVRPDREYEFMYSFGENVEGITMRGEIVDKNGNILTLVTNKMMNKKISLFLQEGDIISGTISLPPNKFPQSDELNISLTAYSYEIVDAFDESDERNFNNIYCFKKDDNSIPFSITVPKKAQYYNLMYYFYEKNVEFSPYDDLERVIMDGVMNKNYTINIAMAKKLTGKIYLPEGKVAPEGGLSIIILSEPFPNQQAPLGKCSFSFYERTQTVIPCGKNSVEFSVLFNSKLSGYVCLQYSLNGRPNDTYIEAGYYSKTGTQVCIDKADALSPSTDSDGIDIYVLEK